MLKRQFLYEVRTNQDNVKRINLLSFMNFKRTLSGSKGNTTSLKHSIQKRVTKYFFQKKKSYKFHKFYRRQLSFTCTNMEPNAFYLSFLRKKLIWRHAKFSIKLFRKKGIKKVKTSKNSMILLHSPQHFTKSYLVLKSYLKYPKHSKKKLSLITKKLRRKNIKQFRYSHVFWRKTKSFFNKKRYFKKKKIFFNKKNQKLKRPFVLLANSFSLFSLLFSSKLVKQLTRLKSSSPSRKSKLTVPCLHNLINLMNFTPNQSAANTFLRLGTTYQTNASPSRSTYSTSFQTSKVFTKHNTPFILSSNSIMLPYKFTWKYSLQRGYVIKKIFYSFLKPNELKKSVLNSRKKFVFNKTVGLLKLNKLLFKRLLVTKRNVISFFRSNLFLNNPKHNMYSTDKLLLLSNKLARSKSYTTPRELRIPRVRFKPGYQRLWRNFRLAFAESINFKYIYQQQLTRHLMRFYRKLNQTYFSFKEMSIKNIIIYSKLLPDSTTFDTFFNNELIFLNGRALKNKLLHVYSNDFIQLEISNWYYIFSRWLSSFILKRNMRLKSLVFRKSLAGRYKVMKQVKQHSNYTPNWIFTTQYDFADIKPFIEVDFFTLSMFMLYDYNSLLYYSPGDIRVTRYNLLRLYNWKYIN